MDFLLAFILCFLQFLSGSVRLQYGKDKIDLVGGPHGRSNKLMKPITVCRKEKLCM